MTALTENRIKAVESVTAQDIIDSQVINADDRFVSLLAYMELVQEMETWHSEQFVMMFTGWLVGRLELKGATLMDMRQAWADFKAEMGKA